MDISIFIICLGVLFIISAFISLHPGNKYSTYTKMLKFFPRLILGIALVFSFISDFSIGIILGFSFIFMFSEVIVQLINIKYGRH